MDPWDIRYTITPRGKRVAIGVTGTGPMIICTPGSVATGNLRYSPYRELILGMRTTCTVVTYDHVGAGLSDRVGYDFSPDGLLEEFTAVVDAVATGPVAFFGAASGAHLAVRYAVAHPERVTCLGLNLAWARGSDYVSSPSFQAYRAALDRSWDLACEYFVAMQARAFGPEAEALRALLKETTSHQALLDFLDAFPGMDVTDILPRVKAPTLVLYEPHYNFYSLELALSMAERIPTARLQMFEERGAAHRAFAEFVVEHAVPDFSHANGSPPAPVAPLSDRERQVLALVAEGKSNREIAERLIIAEATVARHIHNILAKLEVSNRVEAATWWARTVGSEPALQQSL